MHPVSSGGLPGWTSERHSPSPACPVKTPGTPAAADADVPACHRVGWALTGCDRAGKTRAQVVRCGHGRPTGRIIAALPPSDGRGQEGRAIAGKHIEDDIGGADFRLGWRDP